MKGNPEESGVYGELRQNGVAIVVLSFNCLEDTTMPCLESIYRAKTGALFETVVVDNLSTDGTREYLINAGAEKKYPNFRYILNEKNEGFAKGNNTGIHAVHADYYVLLNSDTVVTDYWLDKLIGFFEDHPDVGMVGPVSNSVGNEQCIFVEASSENHMISQGLEWARTCDGDYFFTTMLGFFCVVIKREVFERVGFLDEEFGLGMFEDDDFCLRVVEAGYRLACREDVFVYHKGSISFALLDEGQRTGLFQANMQRFNAKHGTSWRTRCSVTDFAELMRAYLAVYDAGNIEKFRYKSENRVRMIELAERVLRGENRVLAGQKHALEEQLNAIYGSRFWKVASFYYKVRDESVIGNWTYRLLRLTKRKVSSVYAALKSGSLLRGDPDRDNGKNMAEPGDCGKPGVSAKCGESVTGGIYAGGVRGRVSIVLPVYNQANYLEEAIEGVLDQGYGDIELIVVNDGSTDGVEKVLDKYCGHPRIKIFSEGNQKLPKALNNGFAHATGEFLTWTSADNVMLHDQIEELVSFLECHPDVAMAYSDYQAIDDKGMPLKDPSFRPQNQDSADPSIMRLPHTVTYENLHDSGDNFIGASFMYRRYAAKAVGPYAYDTFGGEDYDYWLRLNSFFKIGHLDKVLYKYRVHDNTLNAKANELKLYENIRRLLQRDVARREFYRKPFKVVWAGTENDAPDNMRHSPDEKVLAIFNYSSGENPDVAMHLMNSDTISVCIIDRRMDEYSAVDHVLAKCDCIITTDIADFDLLSSTCEDKLFHVDDVTENLDLIVKVAHSRLFTRKAGISDKRTPASVYMGDRRLRIALQVDNFDKGGMEQVVSDLASCIDRNLVDPPVVIVAKKSGQMGARLRSKGIEVIEVGEDIDAYMNTIRSRRIDVLNTHYSYFGLERAAELGVGIVETIHNSYTWLDSESVGELGRLDRFISRYVAVSRQVKNYHRRRFGVPSTKIETIPNGLNLEGLNGKSWLKVSRKDLGFSENDFIFLNVASFYGVKCHNLMLTAAKDLIGHSANIKLLLVGGVLDKAFYNGIMERIREEGLDSHVRVVDFMERNRLSEIYRLADCFVLPSLQEGWSIAAMEAMYFELPLILTDVGSARDIVINGDIGIVIKNPYADIATLDSVDIVELSKRKNPGNLAELKRAMLDIYDNRDDWRRKATGGRGKILNEFSVEKMGRRYEDVYLATWGVHRKMAAGLA